MPELTLTEVARRVNVSPATLRRWVRDGIVPLADGDWTPAALAQARLVQRLRARGHTMEGGRRAARPGRLAFGYPQDLVPPPRPPRGVRRAAQGAGPRPRRT